MPEHVYFLISPLGYHKKLNLYIRYFTCEIVIHYDLNLKLKYFGLLSSVFRPFAQGGWVGDKEADLHQTQTLNTPISLNR